MRLIRITNGTYGYRPVGSTHPIPKDTNSPPFEVEDAEAARLVKLKVAVYADKPETHSTAEISGTEMPASGDAEPVGERNVNLPEGEMGTESSETVIPDDGDESEIEVIPDYNAEMTVADLKQIMKDCGLTYKVGMSRADMVASLDEYYNEAPPLIDTEGPVT